MVAQKPSAARNVAEGPRYSLTKNFCFGLSFRIDSDWADIIQSTLAGVVEALELVLGDQDSLVPPP